MSGPDLARLTPVADIKADDAESTAALIRLAAEARAYIRSFSWCPPIESQWFADGFGYIVAVFLFEFETPIEGDKYLWVVSGDLPSAYMVADHIAWADDALESYCELMEEWADAVLQGRDLSDVYPVRAPATVENARALLGRLKFLRGEIIPWFGAGPEPPSPGNAPPTPTPAPPDPATPALPCGTGR